MLATKGRASSVVTFGSSDGRFSERYWYSVWVPKVQRPLIIGSRADCKYAIERTACLRYVRGPRSERPTLLIASPGGSGGDNLHQILSAHGFGGGKEIAQVKRFPQHQRPDATNEIVRVGIGMVAGHEDKTRAEVWLNLFHLKIKLLAGKVGQDHVGNDQIEIRRRKLAEALGAIGDASDGKRM